MKLVLTYFTLLAALVVDAQKMNLLPDTILLCMNDTATIEVRQEFTEQSKIRWVTPAGRIDNTRKIRVHTKGKYFVQVTTPSGNTSDSAFVKVLPRPLSRMPDKQTLRAMLAGAIAGPARGVASILAAPGASLARVFQAHLDAKGFAPDGA